ncbi:phosphatase PAP2 family protein [Leucobacter massiliensis]|uniref:Phosphoesterase n=1 Tax=Leucobacter massiliensis TaxID=1686285 RepID=A0A2S9QQY6_9MICO|nr:phosphatase PAP2 family protein [Leucobacter massiliensis]PRI12001.1 phosphoesterase [Leucobacter massiliensis]
MSRLGGRGRALGFVLLWAAIGVGSYVLGVRNPLGQRAEDTALDAADFTFSPPPPLNLVSVPTVAVALLIVGGIAFFAHGIRRAAVVTLVPALTIVASQLLKQQLLTRPQLFELDLPNTFPSGHMTVFAALTGALIWAVPARIRGIVTLGGAALLGAAGWQLLAFGWHRPSDVFGGLALAALAFSLACLIRPATVRGTPFLARTVSIGLLVVTGAVAAAALVLVGLAVLQENAALMLSAGEFGGVSLAALAARTLFLLCSARS